ncbi:hypothetical protein F4808DRAFT_463260 [Astrocystis sublimbata]|nr:hypothetical protein F4808DRAFT_463260 [Astrocystis sublimbata]
MPYTFRENLGGVRYFIPVVIFQTIALFIVALRLWSRRLHRLCLQRNDYAILVALVFSFACTGLFGASINFGLGIHIDQLQLDDLKTFARIETALTCIWGWALLAIRFSIVDTYVKIFVVPWFIKTCYAWLALEIGWAIQNLFGLSFLCQPFDYQFDKSIPGGHCVDILAYYYATHVIIFILDIALTILPIPVLWSLQMDVRRKLTVTAMFTLGLTINVINLLRIAWREAVASPDRTYEYALLLFFTVIEIQLGIILACVPVLRPVMRKLADLYAGSHSKKSAHRLQNTDNSGETGMNPA